MGNTTRTVLLIFLMLTWASVYLASILEHFQVPSQFDTAFTAFVGVILAIRKKDDKPKD